MMRSARMSMASRCTTTPPFLLLAVLLLCLQARLADASRGGGGGGGGGANEEEDGECVRTALGRSVRASLVRRHAPRAAAAAKLSALLYEHVGGADHRHAALLSGAGERMRIAALAPRLERLPAADAARVTVDGVLRPPLPSGPMIRHGPAHTFVFDFASGSLLAAWGPYLHLRPLDLRRYPGVLVNLRPPSNSSSASGAPNSGDSAPGFNSNMASLHVLGTPPPLPPPLLAPFSPPLFNSGSDSMTGVAASAVSRAERFRNSTYIKVLYSAGQRIFFDVAFAYDSTFCAVYGDGPDNITQVVHGLLRTANPGALNAIVSTRMVEISGSCDAATDAFRRPAGLVNVTSAGGKNPNPQRILRAFRNVWKGAVKSDATYLITGYDDGSDVVGAAWVAAACHPRYAYGWVQGAHPVVLAHEIAHTLGAPHDARGAGLMSAQLDLNILPRLSFGSLRSIQTFLDRVSALECLTSVYGPSTSQPGGQNSSTRARLSALTSFNLGERFAGTDVALAPTLPSSPGATTTTTRDVYLLFELLGPPGSNKHGLFFTLNRLRRRRSAASRRRGSSAFVFVVKSEIAKFSVPYSWQPGRYSAGGGIAFVAARAKNVARDLVAIFVRSAGASAAYVVGFDFSPRKGARGGWSDRRVVPQPLGANVRCIGAGSASLANRSASAAPSDLVVAYVDLVGGVFEPRYIIGFALGATGTATGGWSSPFALPWVTRNTVGDIGVTVYDVDGDGALDLVFSHTERIAGAWVQNITVGSGVDATGRITAGWKSVVPDLNYKPDKSMLRLTGGIEIGRVDAPPPLNNNNSTTTNTSSPAVPDTTLVFQGRISKGENNAWIEVVDGLFMEPPPQPDGPIDPLILTGVSFPLNACGACYAKAASVAYCRQQIQNCYARNNSFAVQRVVSARASNPSVHSLGIDDDGDMSDYNYDTDKNDDESAWLSFTGRQKMVGLESRKIFCVGFHELYILPVLNASGKGGARDKCRWDVQPVKILSVGGTQALLADLDAVENEPDTLSAAFQTNWKQVPRNLRYIGPGGTSGPYRVPVTVTVRFRSAREIRRAVIQSALRKLRRRPDFSQTFAGARVKRFVVRRRGMYIFVVDIYFKNRFARELLRNATTSPSPSPSPQ